MRIQSALHWSASADAPLLEYSRSAALVIDNAYQWRRKMFSIGGAGLALWWLSDQSSSILLWSGVMLPLGEN